MLNPGDCEVESVKRGLVDKASVDNTPEETSFDNRPARVRTVIREFETKTAPKTLRVSMDLRVFLSVGRECMLVQYVSESAKAHVPALTSRAAAVRSRVITGIRFDAVRTGVGATEDLRAP